MRSRTGEKGFIFSFDATLAILVTLTALVGLAQIGSQATSYGQHGRLRLERYSDDALRVMRRAGVTRDIIHLIAADKREQARRAARDNLRSVLPREVQFKLTIGKEGDFWLENAYPSTDIQAWENAFENAEERAVSSFTTVETVKVAENLDVLVWCDDPNNQENDFAGEVKKPGWVVKTTDDEKKFRKILENELYPNWYPDAVFLPDVSVGWSDETRDTLRLYNAISIQSAGEDIGGGVVGGGETLWKNDTLLMKLMFGVRPWSNIGRVKGPEYTPGENEMQIIDTTNYITATFSKNENVAYAGDDYYQYQYNTFADTLADTLAEWRINENSIWPGLIARKAFVSWRIYTFGERTALFNTRLAQSTMVNGSATGPDAEKWIELARRAIEWTARENPRPEPVTLYVWRGPKVGD